MCAKAQVGHGGEETNTWRDLVGRAKRPEIMVCFLPFCQGKIVGIVILGVMMPLIDYGFFCLLVVIQMVPSRKILAG
jgi:hypothetical protein